MKNKEFFAVAFSLTLLICGVTLVAAPPDNSLQQRVTELEAQMAELDTRVTTLETDLNQLAMDFTYRFKPDYDSDWVAISPGETKEFTGLWPTTRYMFHLMGHRDSDPESVWHQYNLGTDTLSTGDEYGVQIVEVSEGKVVVYRALDDTHWDMIRIFAWYLPTGTE